jgi:hypothetical protein
MSLAAAKPKPMTQHSEDRLSDSTPANPPPNPGARILPFERPQSDLQRAIQLRAQEAIERERAREREGRRPQPLKKLIVLALAIVPVMLIFGAADGFLRAMRQFTETYKSVPAPAPAVQQQEPVEESQPPQPGVVMLQPYGIDTQQADPDKKYRPADSPKEPIPKD